MHTINRTGDILTVGIFKQDELTFDVAKHYVWSHPGEGCDLDIGDDWGKLAIFPGECHPDFLGWNRSNAKSGDLSNNNWIVIVKRGDQYEYVDWSNVQSKWLNQELTLKTADAKIAQGLALAASLINALGTGLSGAPPPGSVVGGVVLGVGSLILQTLNENVPQLPPPPDLGAITDAVKTVVQDELDAAEAVKATALFLAIAGWLDKEARLAHGAVWGHGATLRDLSDHDEADFRRDLEEYCSDGGSFQVTLDQMVRTPSQAKYMLPAFLIGATTSLQIRLLHEYVRHLDGADFTDEDLQNYQEKMTFYLGGIDSAATALRTFVASKVQNENLQDTDEANTLTRTITNIYTGSHDLTFVDTAKQAIRAMVANVQSDIASLQAGNKTKYFWNSDWDKVQRAKPPLYRPD